MRPASPARDRRSAIDDFLFQPVDGRAAAWLRLAFAVALPTFFWPGSLTGPRSVPAPVGWIFDHVFATFGYWLAVLGLSVPLGLGWRPRLVGLLLVPILLPLAFLSTGRESRLVLLVALLPFSCLRSDAVRWPWRMRDGPTASAGPGWPVRLIQFQLTLLYGVNAMAKSLPVYLSGDALRDMSIALPNFRVDLSRGMVLGPLTIPVVILAVSSTGIEYFLAIGFWFRRARWVAAAVGLAFHLGLTFVVQIYMLHLAAIFLYLPFLLPLMPQNLSRQSAHVNAVKSGDA